jgi:hypothetical protein
MTPQHLLTNHRDRLEATAKHFGISVEQAAVQIAEELTLREARRAGMPDWALDMARATPTSMLQEIALRDNRAPTGPSSAGIIPSSQQMSNVRGAGRGSGWSEPTPLSNPPGVNWADRLMDHQDAKDRAELIQQEAQLKAMQKMAEQTEKLRQVAEQTKKLTEKIK